MSDQSSEKQPQDEAVEAEINQAPTEDQTIESNELAAETSALLEQIQQLEATVQESKEAVLRAHAETENVRRRAERDVQNAHKYALEGFVESLLPIIDSLEQGLAQPAETDEAKALKEGMELTLKIFTDTLAKKNIEQLDPIGEAFNPERHEAMSMQENPEFDANAVIAVFQKGYLLNGRVIRPARVVVNKGKPANIDEKV
ncbi:MAG: nucleotide exchange factor GrpE [Gammaproteobacteria bacterium]|nr:nucleotide exchange factor GrpE [Gammaproteobacteria bacterium]